MTAESLQSFISGGYFITRKVPRSKYMSRELLPDELITVSDCIADMALDIWAIEWANVEQDVRFADAATYGITPERVPEVMKWATEKLNEEKDIGWPSLFLNLEAARWYANKYLAGQENLLLLGIGPREDRVSGLLNELETTEQTGSYGLGKALRMHKPMLKSEKDLGFEVLGYEHGGFHSWICNSLEVAAAEKFNIKPGAYGLLESYENAAKIADYCMLDEVGAEPAIWLPWLIARYALTEE